MNHVWRREGVKGKGSHGDFALLFIDVALSQEELLITSVVTASEAYLLASIFFP